MTAQIIAVLSAESWWDMWLGTLLKGALVLAIGLAVFAVARGARSATRFQLIRALVVALLLLPAVTLLAPSWSVRVDETAVPELPSAQAPDSPTAFWPMTAGGEVSPGAANGAWWTWSKTLVVVWTMGLVAGALHLTLGAWRSHRMICSGHEAAGIRLKRSKTAIASGLGLRRDVRLVLSPDTPTPMTAGWLRPVIVLPDSASTWSNGSLQAALLHELIHMQRGDWLIHMAGQMVRTVHWFNPLAWLAVRCARKVCEQSCDDAVLAYGVRPSVYASLLMRVAESGVRQNKLPVAALCMSAPRGLEERIMNILERGQPLARRSRRAALCGGMAFLASVLAITTFRVEVSTAQETQAEELTVQENPGVTESTEIPEAAPPQSPPVQQHWPPHPPQDAPAPHPPHGEFHPQPPMTGPHPTPRHAPQWAPTN